MFFKKRELRMSFEKQPKDAKPSATPPDDGLFKRNVNYMVHKAESVGVKVFAGVCVYVLLDTFRQVAVETAKHEPKTE